MPQNPHKEQHTSKNPFFPFQRKMSGTKPTSISASLRFSLFSKSWPCSFRKVQRNKLRFWIKFCSSSFPFEYASRILVFKGSIWKLKTIINQHYETNNKTLWTLKWHPVANTNIQRTAINCLIYILWILLSDFSQDTEKYKGALKWETVI